MSTVETTTTKVYQVSLPAKPGHRAVSRRFLSQGSAYRWLARKKAERIGEHFRPREPEEGSCGCLACRALHEKRAERTLRRYARKLRAHDRVQAADDRRDDVRGLYYVQDARHVVGNCVLWERPDRHGYTCELADAGLFTREQARYITENAHGDRVAWRASDVQRLAIGHVHANALHRGAARLPVKGSKPLRQVRSCNRHTDCARADRAADKAGRRIEHCHEPECGEDCCEPFRRRREGFYSAKRAFAQAVAASDRGAT